MAACGTQAGYRGGCRCDDCRGFIRDYQREWRRKNREAARVPGKHGRNGNANYGCTCETCRVATRDESRRRYPNESQEPKRASARRVRAETTDRAHRHRREWTGPELEVAARTDLTAREVALLLGRTYDAVKHKRQKLAGGEPIPTWLAGQRSRLH